MHVEEMSKPFKRALIVIDFLVNQTRWQKSARANAKDKNLEHATMKYSQGYLFHFLPSATAVFDASAKAFVCFHTGKRLI